MHLVGVGGVDHIPALLHLVHQGEELAGGRLSVVVQGNDEISGTLPVSGHQGRMLAEVFRQVNAGNMGIGEGQSPDPGKDVVRGAVVNEDDFIVILRALPEGIANFIYHDFNGSFRAVAGNYKG